MHSEHKIPPVNMTKVQNHKCNAEQNQCKQTNQKDHPKMKRNVENTR